MNSIMDIETYQSNLFQYALFRIVIDPYFVFRFNKFNQYDKQHIKLKLVLWIRLKNDIEPMHSYAMMFLKTC